MSKYLYIICGILVISAMSIGVYIVSDNYASRMERILVKEAELRDLEGKSWQIEQLNEKLGIVYFGYTSCPDICPTALNNLAIALAGMGEESKNFQPIFVSVDPDRDTPAVIGEYLAHFDKKILGLTGTEAQLKSFSWTFGATYSLRKSEGNEHDYVVDHTANLFLVTSEGRFFTLPIKDNPDDLRKNFIRAKKKMLKQNVASPLKTFVVHLAKTLVQNRSYI